MKNSIVLLLIVLFSSCCNAKKATQESPILKEKAVAEIKKDSTAKMNAKVLEESTITKTETEQDTTVVFNQILTKTEHSNIHFIWNELLQKHVSDNGNVNYKSFKTDHKKLLEYIYILDLLKSNPEFDSISKEEKLAYWINAYNALTIDLIIKNYPVKSIKDIKDPWGQKLWELGDKWYSLEDIEHEVLRKMDEPRIHFAIVCASYSCPKLQNTAFTASNLETQLTAATKQFLSDTKRNEIKENSLKLSKIFKWFDKDFEQTGSLIDFLNKYTDITISAKAKISYKDYNWDLNN
ncbi:DUF547 domain-containing protein [Psychroserpens sp. NJDZ02]|uniref:DUF547 domain-containing protein n=1 Tax=Psychroserpens sp. NJDZ02 TaxID=2570561 RepID=UPI0010A768AD|nr:DUF547 domain-containing protein [Psychroserpens sp. NJDZ02]QCE40734.1 DUF547 domain-containing protein [Psychroserpens sp. NJDZ02]